MGDTLVWHYTLATNVPSIFAAGELRPTIIDARAPTLWFSANQIAEMTVKKPQVLDGPNGPLLMTQGSFDELARKEGIFRIGVDRQEARLFGFHSWAQQARVSRDAAERLAAMGRRWGANPEDWYFTFDAVSQRLWLEVEKLETDATGFWRYVGAEEMQQRMSRDRAKHSR